MFWVMVERQLKTAASVRRYQNYQLIKWQMIEEQALEALKQAPVNMLTENNLKHTTSPLNYCDWPKAQVW